MEVKAEKHEKRSIILSVQSHLMCLNFSRQFNDKYTQAIYMYNYVKIKMKRNCKVMRKYI